jgi:hypothetical protein
MIKNLIGLRFIVNGDIKDILFTFSDVKNNKIKIDWTHDSVKNKSIYYTLDDVMKRINSGTWVILKSDLRKLKIRKLKSND